MKIMKRYPDFRWEELYCSLHKRSMYIDSVFPLVPFYAFCSLGSWGFNQVEIGYYDGIVSVCFLFSMSIDWLLCTVGTSRISSMK